MNIEVRTDKVPAGSLSLGCGLDESIKCGFNCKILSDHVIGGRKISICI